MSVAVWFISAVAAYFLGALNPAIVLSKAIYKKDIRTIGSGNPGFTNFKRTFGNRYAWFVFALDLLKAVVPCVGFGLLFDYTGWGYVFGAVYTGLFAFIGHTFPVYYQFKGGKGYLVCLAILWAADWRSGLVATGVLAVLVLTVKIMSVATLSSLAAGSAALFLFTGDVPAGIIFAACTLFVIARHKDNLKRLVKGEEPKFSLGGSKGKNKDKENLDA